MVGILVHGDNHFIVRGRLPDRDVARALIRHWSIIQIGATTPPSLDKWRISGVIGQTPNSALCQPPEKSHYQ